MSPDYPKEDEPLLQVDLTIEGAGGAKDAEYRRTAQPAVAAALVVGLVAVGVSGWQQLMSPSPPPLPPSPAEARPPERCPDEGQTIYVSWAGLPPTWTAAVAEVDVIVLAKRLPGRPEVEEREHCLFTSFYPFTVLEVAKGNVAVGSQLKIGWMARPRDVVSGLRHPDPGEVLVLFLQTQAGRHYLAFGPTGVFRVVEGIVAPYEAPYRSSDVLGRPVDHFLKMLRGYANAK